MQLTSGRSMDGTNLSSLTEKLERCKSEYENLKSQKKKLEYELQQVKRDLDSSQVQKRDLEDSLQIRKFEQNMERYFQCPTCGLLGRIRGYLSLGVMCNVHTILYL